MPERVQKLLARWGISSRREAERLILEQRVKLNGKIVELGDKADPNQDDLEVDGQKITVCNRPQLIYLLLNKPLGVITTCADPQGRTTVIDLLPSEMRSRYGIHPVGRLDANSTGALLLTNDGELTLKLTHPRYHLPKTYHVWLKGDPPVAILKTWEEGVLLSGKKTLPASIKVLQRCDQQTLVEIILSEGRNRQIRRIAQRLGFPVLALERQAIGLITLDLDVGEYRFLTEAELKLIKD
ncbi:pseudouridine synthase [Gloeocapsa sp. PCC 73106]|uniref:pseudouridine synthase n=1 Tax=Gloeocapsa sp. PCC 73106 TaxID=102232 RepID=UPI0002AC37C8|nr:pseudouridine synthase [Gloeocapsa sp. PCC 73106]ELS00227.1 pseudouridine synthase family protein [Gloeocapsa sp. PCC 73106]